MISHTEILRFSTSIDGYAATFPKGVDFPDETGKMSRSDKRGTLRGESKTI
ncbi:MAG: hypothetical protein PUH93_06910 [Clostridia bacterium]|nr:hypothetical protein [Clostridia bacterium]